MFYYITQQGHNNKKNTLVLWCDCWGNCISARSTSRPGFATDAGMYKPRRMVTWRETGPFIQQNALLCDLTILFISKRLQRSHGLDNHWPLTGYTRILERGYKLKFPSKFELTKIFYLWNVEYLHDCWFRSRQIYFPTT
jgi:hypothetical protein